MFRQITSGMARTTLDTPETVPQGFSTSPQPQQEVRRPQAQNTVSPVSQRPYSPLTEPFSPGPSVHALSPPPPQPARVAAPMSFSLPHPSSSSWTNTNDLLPPPPPQPIIRSGGIPTQQKAPPVPTAADAPRRITRSQARGPIGDSDRNPYAAKARREGGGVV
jgi:programmed cell death 6-interacting protein